MDAKRRKDLRHINMVLYTRDAPKVITTHLIVQ